MASLLERISDYLDFGVPSVWLVKPRSRRGWIHTSVRSIEARDGMLRAGIIEVPFPALFTG